MGMQERMEGRRGNTHAIEGDDAEERVVVVDTCKSLSGTSGMVSHCGQDHQQDIRKK
jgi:hypothetical protein